MILYLNLELACDFSRKTNQDCKHVQFDGFDKDPAGAPYGASIPIEMARMLKRDIIVAYEMNGQDIPRDHGYPVRIIIPGIVGARQVKWLTTIKLSKEESSSSVETSTLTIPRPPPL
jgi:sulfite oxidase